MCGETWRSHRRRGLTYGCWWDLWPSTAGNIILKKKQPFPLKLLTSKRSRKRRSLSVLNARGFLLMDWPWGWNALTIQNRCARNVKLNATTASIKRRFERSWSFPECTWSNTADSIFFIIILDDHPVPWSGDIGSRWSVLKLDRIASSFLSARFPLRSSFKSWLLTLSCQGSCLLRSFKIKE